MGLRVYNKKRDFSATPEPKGKVAKTNRHRFVVQEHHASHLHFDFRLEIDGVLKSWAVPKGPSMDPAVKRLAVPTEDHPLSYAKFHGRIPEGHYGAGMQLIWDDGTFKLNEGESPEKQFKKGKLKLELKGKNLKGGFYLFKLGNGRGWLLIKEKDKYAKKNWKLKQLLTEKESEKLMKEGATPAKPKKKKVAKAKTKQTDKPVSIAALLKEKAPAGDQGVKIGDEVVHLTSLDRVYFPDDGYTKFDLLRYYYETAKFILPHLKDRPLIMRRFPQGIDKESFHQHDVADVPGYARTVRVKAEEDGHPVHYIICNNVQTHLYLANFGAIERHPWHSHLKNLDHPDWFIFDLDPGVKVEFKTICAVAMKTKEVIERFGLKGFAKTSGSRGLHIYVPIKPQYSYEKVIGLAKAIATIVAEENPEVATVARTKAKREPQQIYVDFMQNNRGKSVAAPYSVRPRKGATVSAPVTWKEVETGKIRTEDFTIENMPARVKEKGDLFKKVLTTKQSLEKAFKKMKELERKT
jgi:bifunctional non-homologous end joining protein LigD